MEKTGWYQGWQKPIRIGLYERNYGPGSIIMCTWNGRSWYSPYTGINESRYQVLPWRGLVRRVL